MAPWRFMIGSFQMFEKDNCLHWAPKAGKKSWLLPPPHDFTNSNSPVSLYRLLLTLGVDWQRDNACLSPFPTKNGTGVGCSWLVKLERLSPSPPTPCGPDPNWGPTSGSYEPFIMFGKIWSLISQHRGYFGLNPLCLDSYGPLRLHTHQASFTLCSHCCWECSGVCSRNRLRT